jgi:UMF1 family MFS transporter
MATRYGKELGFPTSALITAAVMVQFVAFPFAFAFGALAGRLGAKRSIFIALAVFVAITLTAFSMRTTGQFFLVSFLVGTVIGGAQALSRSLFATMIPRHKAAEMFGFFGVFDRFGGAIGSSIFGFVVLATGSSRPAILSLGVFFVIGGLLLSRVDVARGQQAAREAEARAA